MIILKRNDTEHEDLLSDVEKSVPNKWRWEWLESSVQINPKQKFPKLNWIHGEIKLVAKDHIRKIDAAGTAWCSICNVEIVYSQGGRRTITQHLLTQKHIKCVQPLYSKQQLLPGASMPEAAREMYGASAVYCPSSESSTTTTSSNSDVQAQPLVHILDRVVNMEAMVVAFIAEHNLSFSISESLIDFAQELSKDTPALKKLKMHRTTASYKLNHGLAPLWKRELVEKLKVVPFSLNMDESISKNSKHVFSILVCYYNADTKKIAIEHFGSIDVPSCTSENLYNATVELFQKHQVPWSRMLANLSDSASTMRGKITGVETLIRQRVAGHLLDIDGESCHHMHNVVKKLTSFLDYFLENLFRDVSTEFKFCADSLSLLEEITFHLGKEFRKPVNYHACRWLSVYDVCVEFNDRLDIYKLCFSAFEKADLQSKLNACQKDLKKIESGKEETGKSKKDLEMQKSKLEKREKERLKKKESLLKSCKVTDASRTAIEQVEKRLGEKFKSGTDQGKERKRRIVSSLSKHPNRYALYSSFYESVLPIFKSYVLLFQSEKPLIHKVYHKQLSLVKEFFSYFVLPDALSKCKTGARLLKLDIEGNLLPGDLMFVGSKANKVMRKLGKGNTIVIDFMDRVKKTYVQVGKYIQSKLPLENEVLKAFTAIDPLLVCSPNKLLLKRLLSLPTLMPTVLENDEEDKFIKEVHALCVDENLPSPLDEKDVEVDCLEWWSKISQRYCILFKIVCAVLSIFHGPIVESTFSEMNNIIDQQSGRMNLDTYEAIQDVKYSLKARKPNELNRSVKVFSRSNRLYSPIDPSISNAMRNSYKTYKDKQHSNKENKENLKRKYDLGTCDAISAKKVKENSVALSAKDRSDHQAILEKAYHPQKQSVDSVVSTSSDHGCSNDDVSSAVSSSDHGCSNDDVSSAVSSSDPSCSNDADDDNVSSIVSDDVQVVSVASVASSSKKKKVQSSLKVFFSMNR